MFSRYCDPSYAFPAQSDVIEFAVQTSRTFLERNPKALIAVGSYTIGKERIFTSKFFNSYLFHSSFFLFLFIRPFGCINVLSYVGIAKAISSKVCVSREKMNVLKCLEDSDLEKMLTLDPFSAIVHVLPMKDLNRDVRKSEFLSIQR